MTRTGKCDTCRLRKVRCDEQKPKCGACQKRDRPCVYSYGRVSALVVENPSLLSKHGKPKVAPLVYPLVSYHSSTTTTSSSSAPSTPDLRVTAERDADNGYGVFNTLTPAAREARVRTHKLNAHQRRRIQAYLMHLKSASPTLTSRLGSPTAALATRYMELLGHQPPQEKPLLILGTWVTSIPSRLGTSHVLDLAVEYLVDCFTLYRENNFTNRKLALASKGKALKGLQLAISGDKTRTTYDTALAMKLHYSAEILVGMRSLHHSIHAAGLSEVLKCGLVTGVDEDHYWSLVDNTYIDDVVEAMVTGRTSMYDNDFYRTMTSPHSPAISTSTDPAFSASLVMMHILIQLPRLVCLVRHSISHQENTKLLAKTVSVAEGLWRAVPVEAIETLLHTSTQIRSTPPGPEIRDVVADSLHFDSIMTMTLLTRYWMLQNYLCGLIQTIHRHFPQLAVDSLLPDLVTVQRVDLEAAKNQARSARYALDICPSFPLVPLRFHVPFEVSIGAWYRAIRRLSDNPQQADVEGLTLPGPLDLGDELTMALRMEDFVVDHILHIHDCWDVHVMTKSFLKKFMRESNEDAAGGPIPKWLPLRINFASEDGHMVMKMEYDVPGPEMEKYYGKAEESWVRSTITASPFEPTDSEGWVRVEEFPSQ